jgi:hypothetical protein
MAFDDNLHCIVLCCAVPECAAVLGHACKQQQQQQQQQQQSNRVCSD